MTGRSRVIYRVTTKGAKQLTASVSTWRQIVEAVNGALKGGEDAKPALAR